jgi:diguanylate cyclase (GGDEF)-like protein
MVKTSPNQSDKGGLIDPLTGIYSRLTLQQRLQEEVNRACRYQDMFSVLMIDLDHFKSVNDAFGHLRGDQVLVEFTQRVRETVRDSDLLFRYGGDEFVALLPKTSNEKAIFLAERLLSVMHDQPFGGTPPITLSISIGVASFPDDGQTPETLFEKADLRSYEAKRDGRDRVISEDAGEEERLPFDEFSRLVERDKALKTLNVFFERLPEVNKGLMVIKGQAGSGRSRFLAEVGKVARLQGYEVISLRCRPALRSRAMGAMLEACNDSNLPTPSAEREEFGQSLHRIVEERNRSGIVVLADDLHHADWVTLEMIGWLMLSSSIPVITLAYTTEPALASRLGMFDQIPYQEVVELYPLSMEGIRIWLRSVLQWDVPEPFLKWLYHETDGLPSLIERAVFHLVQRGMLIRSLGEWIFPVDLDSLSLGEYIVAKDQSRLLSLPSPLTVFVGRDDEIRMAKEDLTNNRLLTILGPGGVGKTRLAIQVASELAEYFLNGVYFVSLASVSSGDVLVSTIADALKFTFFGHESQRIQLFNYLREKNILLVLDNFEQLTESATLVVDILEKAPNVRILVTSRERLDLHGEAILELQGMDYPSSYKVASSHPGAEAYNAVQLFLHMARKVKPDFSLSDIEKPYVVEICQRVEGLPLGIELAAAWVSMLSCKEIVGEIEHNLDFLASTLRNTPERHRSLRAVFESSWNLLSKDEKRVLARLSIFRGGFRREAAIRVAGASLSTLNNLVNKSLLRSRPIGKSSIGRYEIHEVLRQYAEEKLTLEPEENGRVRDLHREYYADILKGMEAKLEGPDQQTALQYISDEIDNIRAAWRWATEGGEFSAIRKSLRSLYTFYLIKSLYQEGIELFTSVENALRASISGIPERGEYEKLLLGVVLAHLSAFYQHSLNNDLVIQLLEESHTLLNQVDDHQEMAFLLLRLGACYDDMSEYVRAEQYTQQALDVYREIGDRHAITRALNQLGILSYEQGNFAKAKELHLEAIRINRELGDQWELSRSLINLGNVEADVGEYTQAMQYYQESLEISQRFGDRSSLAILLNNMGDVTRVSGDFIGALHYLDESIQLSEDVGDLLGMAIALNNRGEVTYRLGEYERAKGYFQRTVKIYNQLNSRIGIAYTNYYLGMVAAAQDEWATARNYFLDALEVALTSQTLPFSFVILVEYVPLLIQEDKVDMTLDILASIFCHPSCMEETREKARRMLPSLENKISTDGLASTQQRDSVKAPDELIVEILRSENRADYGIS